MSDLLTAGEVPVDWLWEPFLPKGAFAILSAYMKVGKSTLVYGMVSAIAKGVDFCGHRTNKTAVMILAVEEREREVVNRLLASGVELNDPVMVHVGPLIPDAPTYQALTKTIKDNSIGLIVLDTLSQFWGIEDENDNAMALRSLAPLQALGFETGATVLLVHHNGKMDSVGGRGIRGASALFGVVDQALILKNHGAARSPLRKLETLGRFSESPPEIIVTLNPDTNSYELVGMGEQDAHTAAIREQVRRFLLTNPGAHTAASMMVVLEVKKTPLHRALATPMPWFHRDGTGKKGNPYTYTGLLPGGELAPTSAPDIFSHLIDDATGAALDLSHLMD